MLQQSITKAWPKPGTAPLQEGPHKGGVNGPTQIADRPVSPPAMVAPRSDLQMAHRYGRMQGVFDLIADALEMHRGRAITAKQCLEQIDALTKRGIAVGAGEQ